MGRNKYVNLLGHMPTINSSQSHARKLVLLASTTLLLLCSLMLTATFLLPSQSHPYPNATQDEVCYPGGPSWQYDPTIGRLTISVIQPLCFTTADSHLQVISWYQQQGWAMKTPYDASIFRNYRLGPLSLMVINEVMADTVRGSTRILLITGYQLDIGGP